MGTSRDLTNYSLHTMLPATLDECQTSFQLENAIYFSSQNDQPITQPNPNLPNENFSTRKPQGSAQKVKQLWDENILSFSTNFKTSSSDTKSATTSQPYGLNTTKSHKFNCCWTRCRARDRLGKCMSFVQW